ncbi:IPT/TIG domain-containing protein [Flagellimonas flava]|uniref:IPT/TIG domain-containing protein n=1 Tax=Flagellimonas flava TaxID=570519 RepID=A0A1M5KST6_9FLAO|nr:IPT/TIG domain-containing protein [Allomuricauda flava]SHG55579.1 IPT/TIG domain-containing protein [Allomuricauda flava]
MRIRRSFNLLFTLLVFSCGNDDNYKGPDTKHTQIKSIEPICGPIGEVVVIEGKDFGDFLEDNIVEFDGHNALIKTASTSRLVVVVPSGADSGPVTVKVGSKTAESDVDFVVKP